MSLTTSPTATHPPRCPHRVVSPRRSRWLTVISVCLAALTTATVSLHGKELDYRFVEPAGHMQLCPVEEPEIGPLSLPPVMPRSSAAENCSSTKTPRIAAKWRTNLVGQRDENTEQQKSEQQASKLPGPALESMDNKAEVLVVPKTAAVEATEENALPASQPRDCYHAPPLATMSASIALPSGKLPTNAAAECAAQTSDTRLCCGWAGTEHHWSATCMRHRPLYFEEINAERYGYTVCYAMQPVISAARFFATIPALPYKMMVERPRDCIYTLGHYRPGSCAPRRWNRLPWQITAGVVETGFIAGMILLIP